MSRDSSACSFKNLSNVLKFKIAFYGKYFFSKQTFYIGAMVNIASVDLEADC